MNNNKLKLITIITLILTLISISYAIPAFPGAQGFGSETGGGRGGDVYIVSSLNDHGIGTFRDAVIVPPRNYATGVVQWENKSEYDARVLAGNPRERHYPTAPYIWESEATYIARLESSGGKIIVFNVSGIIDLESEVIVRIPYVTIAGQTSPGGILFAGRSVMIDNHDVIIQHVRFRVGSHRVVDPSDADFVDSLAIRGDGMYSDVASYNVIVDHCSLSWGVDETMSINENATNITIQNCIISEGLNDAGHSEANHGYGLILWGRYNSDDVKVSVHHNYFAHNTGRNPEMNYRSLLDFRNNVIYNAFGGQSVTIYGDCTINAVHNYVKAGPSTAALQIPFLVYADNVNECPGEQIYVEGNIGNLRTNQSQDNWISAFWSMYAPWTYGPLNTDCRQNVEFDAAPVNIVEANYSNALAILETIGATKPFRDSVDQRVIADFDAGTGSLVDNISYPADYPIFQNIAPPQDLDKDGMSDLFEIAQGFNITIDDSALDHDSNGYTNIEEYFYYLIENKTINETPIIPIVNPYDINTNNLIDTNELIPIINAWRNNELTMMEAFELLNKWKRRQRV